MSSPVATVQATDTARQVAAAMRDQRIGSVIVKDGDALDGIITQRDLIEQVLAASKDPEQVQAGDLMSLPVVTIEPAAHIDDAMELMAEHGIRHLVVVLEDEIRGLVSVTDIAVTVAELDRRLRRSLGAGWRD